MNYGSEGDLYDLCGEGIECFIVAKMLLAANRQVGYKEVIGIDPYTHTPKYLRSEWGYPILRGEGVSGKV